MEIKTIEEIEMALTLISIEIGGVHECNSSFTFGLARRIAELGKPIDELSIKELIRLIGLQVKQANRVVR